MANHLSPQRLMPSTTYSLLFCRSVSTAPRPRSLASSLPRSPISSEPSPQQTGFLRSEFPLKKVWPPDFGKLSAQEQFRYEKKFNRRVKLATKRPLWNKGIQILQVAMSAVFIAYVVLFPGPAMLKDMAKTTPSS